MNELEQLQDKCRRFENRFYVTKTALHSYYTELSREIERANIDLAGDLLAELECCYDRLTCELF